MAFGFSIFVLVVSKGCKPQYRGSQVVRADDVESGTAVQCVLVKLAVLLAARALAAGARGGRGRRARTAGRGR